MPDGAAAMMPGAAPAAPPPGAGIAPAPGAAGPTAPATVAPQSNGMRMRGMVKAAQGIRALSEALGLIGAASPEGQVLAQALGRLGKTFGDSSGDLTQAEAKLGVERAAPVSQPSPAQGQQFQQAIKARLAGAGMPGGASPSPTPGG
jgi:hypothetical protein